MKFQNPSLNSVLTGRTDGRTDERTSRNQYVPHFFKVGGIKMQIKTLAQQLQASHLPHAFNDATSVPHGYLLINLKPNTPDILRFRTNIFSTPAIYINRGE